MIPMGMGLPSYMRVVHVTWPTEVLSRIMVLKNVNQTFGRRFFVPSIVPQGVVGCSKTKPLSIFVPVPCTKEELPVSPVNLSCEVEQPSENDLDLVSQFDLDNALDSKFDGDLVTSSSFLYDYCTCHNMPKGACFSYVSSVINFIHKVWSSKKSNQDGLQQLLQYSKLDFIF